MSCRDDEVRLRHVLDAAREAVARSASWPLARLPEIVGEAAGKVSPAFREAHPELPWAEMGGLRNRLAHAYFDVDLDVLLDIVATDLPPLIARVERLLS